MNYNESLDYIYSSFMEHKEYVAGKLDRDVRNPKLILDIAQEMNLIPEADKIIKITGSKGKGTVTRLISAYLLNSGLYKVGMLVSPEEIDHYDRLRINGIAMTEKEFVKQLSEIIPFLEKKKKTLKQHEYLSPSGIFLLIGLRWFKESGVEHFILECGRGAAYDEVGRVNSLLSVVTSILFEHPTYLGPNIDDIARDKLAIAETSQKVLLGSGVKQKCEELGLSLDQVYWEENHESTFLEAPKWYLLDNQIAQATAKYYLAAVGRDFNEQVIPFESASFGKSYFNSIEIYYEALVSQKSFDDSFVDLLLKEHKKVLFIASLPDDKDLVAIDGYLREKSQVLKHVVLTGTRGYLHYNKTGDLFAENVIARIGYNDTAELIKSIESEVTSGKPDCIYFFGTHTFIRLIKRSFFM